MCTGLEIAALATMGASAGASIYGNMKAADAQMGANISALTEQYTNSQRLAQEVNESTDQQYTDRMREARKELASLSVMLGETGATGNSGQRLLYESAYGENVDLMRIEDNAKDELDAIHANNLAAHKSVVSQNEAIATNAKYQNLGAFINFGSQAMSVGMSAQNRKALLSKGAKGG